MIEDKGYYSLDKTFARIIEQYLVIYVVKSFPLNKFKYIQKYGIHFQSGVEHNSSKIGLFLFLTLVIYLLFSQNV